MKVFCIGGGTGGHISPLRSVIDEFLKRGWEPVLIVADAELDRKLVQQNFSDVETIFFRTGKFRRYFSFENLCDVFRIFTACFYARSLLKKYRPDVLFFKGGFVGFPFFIAFRFFMRYRGFVFTHESDISCGTLNRFLAESAHFSFENFQGYPLFFQIHSVLSVVPSSQKKLLVFGGSQGAVFINLLLERNLLRLLDQNYFVILVAGKGKQISFSHSSFRQMELLSAEELAQELASADLVVARAGANSLFEILAAKKPAIFIPLPSVARNHQFFNAKFFADQGLCYLLEQNSEAVEKFIPMIEKLSYDIALKKRLEAFSFQNSAVQIVEKIVQISQSRCAKPL